MSNQYQIYSTYMHCTVNVVLFKRDVHLSTCLLLTQPPTFLHRHVVEGN